MAECGASLVRKGEFLVERLPEKVLENPIPMLDY